MEHEGQVWDLKKLGIEETDSCPACKRLLSSMVEDNRGGILRDGNGEFVCSFCGVVFVPKSIIRKMKESKQEQSRIIRPGLIVPGVRQ